MAVGTEYRKVVNNGFGYGQVGRTGRGDEKAAEANKRLPPYSMAIRQFLAFAPRPSQML